MDQALKISRHRCAVAIGDDELRVMRDEKDVWTVRDSAGKAAGWFLLGRMLPDGTALRVRSISTTSAAEERGLDIVAIADEWAEADRNAEGNHVLVVDDDLGIRDVLAASLEYEGYRVTTSGDGAHALDRLRAGEEPAVIVTDLMMPGLDGWQLAAELSLEASWRRIPLVVLTASRPPPPFPLAAHVLAKPVNLDALVRAIETCRRGTRAQRASA